VSGRPARAVRPDLVGRARAAREALGSRAFVLGHHYQRDEVIEFADVTGDSFKLARDAATGRTPSTSCSAASTSWPRAPTS
jgi:quinolinate synthase